MVPRIALSQTASILIGANQPDAEVLLDDQLLGKTDQAGQLYKTGIPAGQHVVQVRKAGFGPVEERLTFSSGLTETLTVELERLESVKGRVLVDLNVGGAEVYVDDVFVGSTLFDGKLSFTTTPGMHAIRVQKLPDFEAQTKQVSVSSGGIVEIVPFQLVRPSASSPWHTNPYLVLALALMSIGVLAWLVVTLTSKDRRKRFDRYDIVKIIGRGGMATVYLAKDRKLKELVALKILNAIHTKDRDLVRRFRKEKEALDQMYQSDASAPIVRAYRFDTEHGDPSGRPFIAMEYIPGVDLKQYLQQQEGGRLPVDRALDVARWVAKGLKVAHDNGIYHRDIAPDNVLVKSTEPKLTIKLIDFGVAKHEYTAVHTMDASVFGKPPYMSPEQFGGRPVDDRSDVYSLGCLAYAMFTGNPPFSDPKNPIRVLHMHETAEVPPLPEFVPELARTLVYDMLKKDPDVRPRIDEVLERINALDHKDAGSASKPAENKIN